MDPDIYRAAMGGDREKLHPEEITKKFAVQFTKNNNSVLHIVAEFGHSPCVSGILNACPLLLGRRNDHGDTPLHLAAAGGHDDVVELLIDFAAKKPRKPAADGGGGGGGGSGGVPSSGGGQSDSVESQSQITPAPVEQTTPPPQPAAANVGGGGGDVPLPTVRELLKARNRDGDTPLHLAARLEYTLPVVSKLIKADGEVDGNQKKKDGEVDYSPNKAGETPLYMVVARGSDVAAVTEILEKCKSPAYRGPGGRTAMHAAVTDISKDEILNKLLERAPPNLIKQQDSKGWTPLHFAAHNGNLEAVKKLLVKDKSVAYVKANTDEGNTALHMATAMGNVRVMNEILQEVPDSWEMANSKGRTILHTAVDMERDFLKRDMERDFLKRDMERGVAANFILKMPWAKRLMNRKDNDGNTPFHLLASKGKLGLHMYPGADMLALNNENMTPLDIQNREARRTDLLDAVKTMPAVYIAEMEHRLESLLAQRLATHFEQVLDAISGHRTVKGSTKDETSPVEDS